MEEDGKKIYIRWRQIQRERKNPDGSPRDQPKHSLKRQQWKAKTNTWLTEPPQSKDEKSWQFLFKDYGLKQEYVHCASTNFGGLRFHVMWTQRREFPHRAEDVSTVIIREPCTQNYLITVHMFIYSTTTSICAFWTVTKWCFIACCIDDANYNCSSTIFGIKKHKQKKKTDKKKNISVISVARHRRFYEDICVLFVCFFLVW